MRTPLVRWMPCTARTARDAAHTRAADDDNPDPVQGYVIVRAPKYSYFK